MKWCQLVGFFLRTWKQFQRQFKDDFLDSQGQPRDTWQGFGREQSSCRFRNETVDVGSLHSGKPRQCLEKNKKTGTYLADCSLLGPSMSFRFFGVFSEPPSISALDWFGTQERHCEGVSGRAVDGQEQSFASWRWVKHGQQFFSGSPRICGRDLRMNLIDRWWLGSGESFPTGFISDISELSESDNSAG